MKSLVSVAKDENITANQVKSYLENGFRILRLAYSPLFRKGMYFDASSVLKNMVESSGFTCQELCDIFQQYISDGLSSENRELWEHIVAGKPLTRLDLISFLWAKFEADIIPMHAWDLFGK